MWSENRLGASATLQILRRFSNSNPVYLGFDLFIIVTKPMVATQRPGTV
jgi:hypothetical protein